MDKNKKKEILLSIINKFEKNKIRYCFLRNYENLPEKFGNDIDILTDFSSAEKVTQIIKEVTNKYDWVFNQRGKNLYFILHEKGLETLDFFRLDIVTKIQTDGIEYFSANKFLQFTEVSKNGFRIPEQNMEFFHIVSHSILGPNYNKRKYIEEIDKKISFFNLDWNKIEILFRQLFKDSTSKKIINQLKNEGASSVLENKKHLKKELIKNKNMTMFPISVFFKKWLSRVRRYIKPPGKFVLFIGPDGSGKSTTSSQVKQILNMYHYQNTHQHLGFRPSILPTKSEIMFWKNNFQKKEQNNSKNNNSTHLLPNEMGYLKFLYFSIDYFLGYLLLMRPILIKNGFAITERYFSDYLAGTRKNPKVKVPISFIKLVYFFLPKPDFVFLLYNDPETIFSRRKELSVEEIRNQIEIYQKIDLKEKFFKKIKTHDSPSLVASEIIDFIFSEWQEKPE